MAPAKKKPAKKKAAANKAPPPNDPRNQPRDPWTGGIAKLEISPEEAYREFVKLGEVGTLKQLHQVLTQKHRIKISLGTIQAWSSRHNWRSRRDVECEEVQPGQTDKRLDKLQEIATKVDARTLDGLIAKMIQTLDRAVESTPITGPKDVVTMVEAFERLIAVKIEFRNAMMPVKEEKADQVEEGGGKLQQGSKAKAKPAPVDDKPEPPPQIGEFEPNIVQGGEAR